jgi:hypothetical protein
VGAPFSNVTASSLNTVFNETDPGPSGDGALLRFTSDRLDGSAGGFDLWQATGGPLSFGSPTDLVSVNTVAGEFQPYATPADLDLYFASDRLGAGSVDLYHATRQLVAGTFLLEQTPSFAMVNSAAKEQDAVISVDQLRLYFSSNREDAGPFSHVYTATRNSVSVGFSAATPVTELTSLADDRPSWLSDDGCRLYLSSSRSITNTDIYVASKPMN